jgi:hypothetical protein
MSKYVKPLIETADGLKIDEALIPNTIARKSDIPNNVGGTQADWNQNDETAPDYVKNRTHYEEISRGVSKTFDCTVIDRRIGNDFTTYELGSEPFTVEFVNVIKTNNLFEVIFNGVEYICSVIYEPDSVTWLIGNTSLLLGTMLSPSLVDGFLSIAENKNLLVDTGEPFCIVWHDSINTIGAMYAFESGTYNVTVTPMERVVHKLDKKYLPDADWNAKEGEAGYIKNKPLSEEISEVLPETAITLDGEYASLIGTFNLEPDRQYIVSWNGESYTCTAIGITMEGVTAVILGNAGAAGLDNNDTGEPFYMAYAPLEGGMFIISLLEDDYNTTITLKIEGKTSKLLYSYLPDELYRTEMQWILPETTVAFNADGVGQIQIPMTLIPDETYTVYWKGTPYTVVAQLVNNAAVVLGNMKLLIAGNDTGEPFLIVPDPSGEALTMIATLEGDTSATVGIRNEVIIKIPQKYLPEYNIDVDLTDYAKKSDLTDYAKKSDLTSALPTVSAADNGAFLRVVNGSWAAVMLPSVEDGEF